MEKILSQEDTRFVTDNLLINYLLWDDNELLKTSFIRNNKIELHFDPQHYYFCITGLNKKYNVLQDPEKFNFCVHLALNNYDQYYQLLNENHYSGNILMIKPDNSKQLGILFSAGQDPLCTPLQLAQKLHQLCLKRSFVQDNIENRLTTSLSQAYSGLENIHLAYQEARELNNLSFFRIDNKVLDQNIIATYKKECDALLINENIRKFNSLMCTGTLAEIYRQVDFIYYFQVKQSLNYALFQIANSLVENVLLLLSNVYDIPLHLKPIADYEDLDSFVTTLKQVIRSLVEVRDSQSLYSYDIILVLSYIKSNYRKNLSLNEMSEYVGVSSTYLSRQFNIQVGMSLPDFVNQFRVGKAAELLKKQDLTINEISSEVGFDSPRYFTQIFKKYFNCTPQSYRTENVQETD